ncbi:Ku protein [Variovorax dokdonensis]|uniref:Non-homologous end joining protein Ku n=1 Tax=Variovorax dokdonensis TaxID=344883 RepID=A0ABT7NAF3_9BURK|nr:Ku protein [Variovorax dokdonensis]MDM0044907.1 Ku protein [Variovorax dokdonensis]
MPAKKRTAPKKSSHAKGAPRALWKGAISFGLVHVPVALYPATRDHGVDFDWLDKRSMDPVGYKRINKRTGREVSKEHIAKGVDTGGGNYVLLGDDEIGKAYPTTTRTIEIESFVPAQGIPFIYMDRPYYLAPIDRGAKVYALLREALLKSQRVGVARVVIQTREHLAMLIPSGAGLVLNLLRWSEDIRPWSALELPPEGARKAGISGKELQMAERLIEEMADDFEPGQYHDAFTERIEELVKRKAAAGKARPVTESQEEESAPEESNVVDLTQLLQRSLRQGKGAAKSSTKAAGKTSTKAAAKTSTKRASKRSATGTAARKKAPPRKSKAAEQERRAA